MFAIAWNAQVVNGVHHQAFHVFGVVQAADMTQWISTGVTELIPAANHQA
jgi:hypothetical protein